MLNKLRETQDFKILDTIYNILNIQSPKKNGIKKEKLEPQVSQGLNKEIVEIKDESESEIETTPLGRKSPIILTKKNSSTHSLSLKDKKKCPESW